MKLIVQHSYLSLTNDMKPPQRLWCCLTLSSLICPYSTYDFMFSSANVLDAGTFVDPFNDPCYDLVCAGQAS
jgi:hypothetical protein